MTRALSVKDVCQRLGIGPTKFRMMRAKFHAYKVGGAWRVDESDLLAYIEKQKAAARPALSEAQAVSKAFDPDDLLPEVPAECLL